MVPPLVAFAHPGSLVQSSWRICSRSRRDLSLHSGEGIFGENGHSICKDRDPGNPHDIDQSLRDPVLGIYVPGHLDAASRGG